MRGLSSILSIFRNKFDKFNNIGARMLDFLSYEIKIILKILKSYFGVKQVRMLPYMRDFKTPFRGYLYSKFPFWEVYGRIYARKLRFTVV